jgi:hypothetical protein
MARIWDVYPMEGNGEPPPKICRRDSKIRITIPLAHRYRGKPLIRYVQYLYKLRHLPYLVISFPNKRISLSMSD